jgi:hypothetical protein
MSYRALHDHCQGLPLHIRRNAVRDKILALTGVNRVLVMKTALDIEKSRGFFLSPENTEHQLVKQFGGYIIVLARGMEREWDRFVYVKEMMHLFDSDDQLTDRDSFDRLMNEIAGGPSPNRSPQAESEVRCYWKALCALCPEHIRKEYAEKRSKQQIDDFSISLP